MSDVLDNERGPAPLWVVPVTMLAVVAVIVTLAWRWSGSPKPPAARATPTATASQTPAPLPSPVLAGNACGGDVEQPLLDVVSPTPRTGLRLLVGDRDLRLVDVDARTSRVLTTRSDGRSFTDLVADGDEVVTLLRDRCSAAGYGTGVAGVLDPHTGAVTSRGRGDEIIPGHPVTVAQFDEDGAIRLRELGRQTTTPVPPGWVAYARTPTGYFASTVSNGYDAGVPPEVGIGVPTNKKLIRSFGAGNVVGASPDLLFWLAGDCPRAHCLLTWTTTEGTNTAQPIDTYVWGGVVSPDGTKMAFRKQRASGRFGGHPGPPNDIAVLESTAGGQPLRVLPGLVLPAKAGLTMTWSPDSQWLVIGADLGTGPAVLIWRQGMDRPAQVPLPPTGGGTTGPPALLVLPR